MDETNEDPRLPHHRTPKEYVSLDTLSGMFILFPFLSLYFLFLGFVYLYLLLIIDDGMGLIADIGVLYWKLDAKNYENDPELNKIREERGYNYFVSFELSA